MKIGANEIVMRRPDDMHFHPREGEMMENVLPYASVFARIVAMGNLPIPITTGAGANIQKQNILRISPTLDPVMTIMLTKDTTPEIVREAHQGGVRIVKDIPGSTSTNSEYGIPLPETGRRYSVLEEMESLGMIYSIHGEYVSGREESYYDQIHQETNAIPFLKDIVKKFPRLKIVVEHASTSGMVNFVLNAPKNVAATLTLHHAIFTIAHILYNKWKIGNPLLYCKPILKLPGSRDTVREAMLSNNPKFFFGSDSAPHPFEKKLADPPAAGVYTTGKAALVKLLEIFKGAGDLWKFEDFVSRFGAEFYELPLNKGQITFVKEDWVVPKEIGGVRVLFGGETLNWKVVS